MRRFSLIALVMLMAFSFSVSVARSADKPNADQKVDRSKLDEKPARAAENDEAETLAFAREHHPELADLLANLKQMNEKEYRKGLRQLNQARQRLARVGRNSSEKYELALAGWKLDSRIQLLAARMTMSDDPVLEEQLRQLVRERQDVRIKELTAEKAQLNQRLSRVEKQLQGIETDREKSLQNEIDRIKKGLAGGKTAGGKLGQGTVKKVKKAAKKSGLTSGEAAP